MKTFCLDSRKELEKRVYSKYRFPYLVLGSGPIQSTMTLLKDYSKADTNRSGATRMFWFGFHITRLMSQNQQFSATSRLIFGQIVVQEEYRKAVLSVAHDSSMNEHLGVRKSSNGIMAHLYRPKIRRNVAENCWFCDISLVMWKPNQNIRETAFLYSSCTTIWQITLHSSCTVASGGRHFLINA
jgi:hypothetical protein